MTPDDISTILSDKIVKAVENACKNAIDAAGRHDDPTEGMEAARQLLLQLLCAAIITPQNGAQERAKRCAEHLVKIVDAAIVTKQH